MSGHWSGDPRKKEVDSLVNSCVSATSIAFKLIEWGWRYANPLELAYAFREDWPYEWRTWGPYWVHDECFDGEWRHGDRGQEVWFFSPYRDFPPENICHTARDIAFEQTGRNDGWNQEHLSSYWVKHLTRMEAHEFRSFVALRSLAKDSMAEGAK